MVISFAVFCHLYHNIVSNMLQSYLFYFYWNPHIWNLGLGTKITFLLQLEQKLWHIYRNKVRNWQPSWIFSWFFSFSHMIMICHAACCVYLIPWPRICQLRPPNHYFTWSNFRDIGNLRFWGGHFEKWPISVMSPSFFSGNIANMIPESPLNIMVPLTEDHGDPR